MRFTGSVFVAFALVLSVVTCGAEGEPNACMADQCDDGICLVVCDDGQSFYIPEPSHPEPSHKEGDLIRF